MHRIALMCPMTTPAPSSRSRPRPDLLDAREHTLVRLAAEGLTGEEIGRMLGMHPLAVRCLARAMHMALADLRAEEDPNPCASVAASSR